ncbi:MAG: MerR family transcriptional regulator [Verrucomicrobiales bacterium]|nr:MerR family transcriptional regulator [Verrucomicrobiales bacterium]
MRLYFVYISPVVSFQHPIQVVARLTGLTPHVIRVWEKRYQAVMPTRTGTNRRLYSDAEVDRLRLLAQATAAGHKIGIIAKLETEDLKRLVATVSGGATAPSIAAVLDTESQAGLRGPAEIALVSEPQRSMRSGTTRDWDHDGDLLRAAMEATATFDSGALQRTLERAAVQFGHNGVLHRVVCPLAADLGERWQQGLITAAHEHFASAVIRDFLTRLARPYAVTPSAPCAVVTTPSGQLHELGAVIVAAAATHWGWKTVYLGPSLPAAEIAGAATQNRARAVLLSVVYPADDASLPAELAQLRQYLPDDTEIFIGGRAARAYAPALKQVRVHIQTDLESLGDRLEEMRANRFGA